ncbi:MAG: nucleotidyltransferase domain-containing protein [Gammaproteobacteria bacterium]|nr:nucleotidyltransferase domain-containing protein [Gammaproteobacteria bacterium]
MSAKQLQRAEALAVLKRHKAEFERVYGVTVLGLFGSAARDEATDASDVDVVLRMREPDLFSLVHIKDTLQQAFGRGVDVVHYRERMYAYLKQRIDQEAVYV